MRKRILLVDDDVTIRRLVLMTLGTVDFDVTVARDGASALELARAQPPDLVLLDVMMPDLDGFAVAAALRAEPHTANAPIVMLTARGGEDDLARGRALGVIEHFCKPFSPLRLLQTVYEILERSSSDRSWTTHDLAG